MQHPAHSPASPRTPLAHFINSLDQKTLLASAISHVQSQIAVSISNTVERGIYVEAFIHALRDCLRSSGYELDFTAPRIGTSILWSYFERLQEQIEVLGEPFFLHREDVVTVSAHLAECMAALSADEFFVVEKKHLAICGSSSPFTVERVEGKLAIGIQQPILDTWKEIHAQWHAGDRHCRASGALHPIAETLFRFYATHPDHSRCSSLQTVNVRDASPLEEEIEEAAMAL